MRSLKKPPMIRHTMPGLFCCLLSLLVCNGCGSSESEAVRSIPIPKAEQSATPDAVASQNSPDRKSDAGTTSSESRRKYTGISLEIPESWVEIPNQQFVDSKFTAPTGSGDVEVTLTSMGGGIESNLDRWVQQVQTEPGEKPVRSTLDVCGIEAAQVDVRGTFNARVGADSGPKNDWRLIGIAVPLPRDFFIKAVGPREAVAEFQSKLPDILKTAQIEK